MKKRIEGAVVVVGAGVETGVVTGGGHDQRREVTEGEIATEVVRIGTGMIDAGTVVVVVVGIGIEVGVGIEVRVGIEVGARMMVGERMIDSGIEIEVLVVVIEVAMIKVAMIGEVMIGETMTDVAMIGEVMIGELMIGEVMIGEVIIGEAMIGTEAITGMKEGAIITGILM